MQRFTTRVIAAVAVAIGACSDLGDPYVQSPRCYLSADRVDYGSVEVGFFTDRVITIVNEGDAPLEGDVGVASPHYLVTDGEGHFMIEPDGSIEVTMRFAPADTGSHTVMVDLGNGCPAIELRGIGGFPSEGPRCVVDPAVLDFGELAPGEFAEASFEIRNVGLIAVALDIASTCEDAFDVLNGAGPSVLAVGDTVRALVRFAPPATGDYDCELTIGPDCAPLSCVGSVRSPTTVSYAGDVQPIFNNRCVVCHDKFGQAGLDLRAAVSHQTIVGVVSQGYAPALRIAPRNPSVSVLYGKIAATGQFGDRMPPTGQGLAVPAAEVETVRTWILEGALNN